MYYMYKSSWRAFDTVSWEMGYSIRVSEGGAIQSSRQADLSIYQKTCITKYRTLSQAHKLSVLARPHNTQRDAVL